MSPVRIHGACSKGRGLWASMLHVQGDVPAGMHVGNRKCKVVSDEGDRLRDG